MILITLLWSTAGVVTRHLEAARSFEVTFWRSAATVAALAAILSGIGGKSFWRGFLRPSRRVWISGLCWSIMFSAFMVALTLTSVANVLVIMALGPLSTALSARIFLAHRLHPVTWWAIVAAGAGISWMFAHDAGQSVSFIGSCVALAIPLGAAVNFTLLQWVAMQQGKETGSARFRPYEMQQALLVGGLVSAGVTLPLAWPLQASLHDIGLLSMLGVFQLAVPCLMVTYVSRVLPAPEITLLSLLEIVFGVTWAWLWAGEMLSMSTLVGGIVVLGALSINVLVTMMMQRKFTVV